jgi:hypothetical protein
VLLQQLRQVLTAPPAVIQSDHTKETRNRGTDRSDGHPENIKEAIFSLFRDKRSRAPTPAPRLTCLRPAARGASPPAARWPSRGRSRRPYRAGRPWRRAAAGPGGGWGRARVPIGGSRAASGGRRKKRRGWRVCFYRGVYRFHFSVRMAIPFFGKISAKPSARHDVLRRGIPLCVRSLLPLPCALAPVGFINPCRPGQLQAGCASTYSVFTGLLGPCLDHLKIPSFFTISPLHQFLAACIEY